MKTAPKSTTCTAVAAKTPMGAAFHTHHIVATDQRQKVSAVQPAIRQKDRREES